MNNIENEIVDCSAKTSRILLVEDDPTNRFVTISILVQNGFEIVYAVNGLEACETLETESFDLILMDISMPEMDGFEATRKIRNFPDARAQVPIIALTAHNQDEDRENCLKAGMDDYLSKPVSGPKLVSMINSWLGKASNKSLRIIDNPEPGGEEEHLIDERILEQLGLDTDSDVFPDLIQTFLKVTELRIENISRALKATDMELLELETHSLGSSAATFGAMQLHNLARIVELACEAGEVAKAIDLAHKIPALAEASSEQISTYLIRHQDFDLQT